MRRTTGSTTIYVLLVISVLFVASLGAAALSMGSLARARSDQRAAIAFNAAQAALEMSITTALANLRANGGEFSSASGYLSSDLNAICPSCTVSYSITPWSSDTTYGYVTASVTYNNFTKSLRTSLNAKDLGVWNNAIFAGAGASGRSINGNVDIRGSVHILGDGEPYTDTNGDGVWTAAEAYTDKNKNGVWDPGEAFTDTNGDKVWTAAEPFNDLNKNGSYDDPFTTTELISDMSGTGKIGNNYSGMPSDLEAMLPAVTVKNGVETLSAELRVKHGQFALSGTATVGQSGTVDGGTSKAAVDGVFVNDGWAGNKGSSNVYSDNGTTNAYDVEGLGIEVPILSGLGAQNYMDSGGTVWTNEESYLNARCLTIPTSTVTSGTTAFSYGPDIYGNSITFTPKIGGVSAKLVITGIVKVPNGFQLGDKDTITFAGNGTFWCDGSLKIDCNWVPAAGFTFPTTARTGFIVKNTLALASGSGSSQLTLCGAFYAQGKITSQKQNQIAGTFVSSYFDMGTNVPNIYQVPKLRTNLPPAMPGSNPIVYLKTRGWRERQ